MNHDEHDLEIMGKTLWGECRGEPHEGQIAVAWVIRNRAERPRFAGSLLGSNGAVAHVCLAPYQFSCWNDSDPQSARLKMLQENDYAAQRAVAWSVLSDAEPDPTNGADHYHTITKPVWANEWPPNWAPQMKESARFGGHVFYDSRQKP